MPETFLNITLDAFLVWLIFKIHVYTSAIPNIDTRETINWLVTILALTKVILDLYLLHKKEKK